ncbi:MAG: DUF1080 domain-containing protein [Planctomycetaceae bacterium]|nr:DUF1080 domain-containing protein [Planctomycetaceae bacterium]
MKHLFCLFAAVCVFALSYSVNAQSLTDAEKADGWVSLFDGKTLDGWESNENYNSYAVKDGAIVGTGEYCHLFYMKEKYKNFEFKIDCKINHNGNAGVYVKVPSKKSGWPTSGFELQVNSSHSDKVRSGSLYNIVRIYKAPHADDEWFTYHVIAKDNKLTVLINGEVLYQYEDPTSAYPTEGEANEKTKHISQEGFFALQQHDSKSTGAFKNIKVKKL